jgi:hypothetical protein
MDLAVVHGGAASASAYNREVSFLRVWFDKHGSTGQYHHATGTGNPTGAH